MKTIISVSELKLLVNPKGAFYGRLVNSIRASESFMFYCGGERPEDSAGASWRDYKNNKISWEAVCPFEGECDGSECRLVDVSVKAIMAEKGKTGDLKVEKWPAEHDGELLFDAEERLRKADMDAIVCLNSEYYWKEPGFDPNKGRPSFNEAVSFRRARICMLPEETFVTRAMAKIKG